MDLDEAAKIFREFVSVIKALRTPGTGCPWDLEQDHHTLRPYIVEEAYEVLETIDRGDDRAFREELGDLLLQVVLHAQIADDRGAFSITEVVRGITEKMVRRHPHVFGELRVSGTAEVKRNWEQIKAAEREAKGEDPSPFSALGRIPESLPALLRAGRLGQKAASAGTDARSLDALLNRLREQFADVQEHFQTVVDDVAGSASAPAEVARKLTEESRRQVDSDLGDLLFILCQLARWLGLNAEDSLRACNWRFVESFEQKETTA
jgi:XTP/dITP diphosphohydrolase